MDDKNFQSSLCITSMKQKLSGPIESHGPFITCYMCVDAFEVLGVDCPPETESNGIHG